MKRTSHAGPSERAGELPVVDATRCTGSGWCVAICPTACLAMAAHQPWMPRPLDCVSCGLCADVCPVHAIQMQRPDAEPGGS